MKIQKIIRASYTYPTLDIEGIQKALDEGWTVVGAPAVIPSFAGYSPQIIFVVEKELNI